MQIFKNIFIIIFFLSIPSYSLSVTFVKSDLNFLNVNDKQVFIEKCFEKDRFIDTSQCLNFLGLKILLNNFDNIEISKENFKYIKNQSINYLEEAARRGFVEAYINLGWVYSNDKFELQDFIKSAEYFNLYYSLKKKTHNLVSYKKKIKMKLKLIKIKLT